MFKFLFGKKEVITVKETQRETIERALGEVNEILGGMAVKAKVSVDLETGLVALELPEQMPDEALALPAPEPEAEVDTAEVDTPEVEDKATEDQPKPEDQKAAA